MKVHKLTVLVVDTDNLGADEVKVILDSTRFANDSIAPTVMDVETVEVDWSDEHPLNRTSTMREEFARLFSPPPVFRVPADADLPKLRALLDELRRGEYPLVLVESKGGDK